MPLLHRSSKIRGQEVNEKNGTNKICGSFNFGSRYRLIFLQMSAVRELINKSLFISPLPTCCPSLQSYHDDIDASLTDCDQNRWIFFEKTLMIGANKTDQNSPFFHEISNFSNFIVDIC